MNFEVIQMWLIWGTRNDLFQVSDTDSESRTSHFGQLRVLL